MPFLYFGSLHSFFPAHIEDFSLYSLNYLHFGQPKIWIVVPPRFALKLTLCIMNSAPNLIHSSCFNLLGHKYFIPSPKWLQEHGIPFKVVVQEEGQSIIVAPNAVHWGWNTGYNIAEACNFGTLSWIPFGIVAPKCSCMGGEVHMDLERLIAATRPELLECCQISQPHIEEKVTDQSGVEIVEIEESDNAVVQDQIFPAVPKKRTGRKTPVCPKVTCGQIYLYGNKQKLLKHIKNKHKDDEDFDKTMSDFNLLFPERNSYSKKCCPRCGKMIAGRASAMKKHQMTRACVPKTNKL